MRKRKRRRRRRKGRGVKRYELGIWNKDEKKKKGMKREKRTRDREAGSESLIDLS